MNNRPFRVIVEFPFGESGPADFCTTQPLDGNYDSREGYSNLHDGSIDKIRDLVESVIRETIPLDPAFGETCSSYGDDDCDENPEDVILANLLNDDDESDDS